ncbi:MAG: zinc ribbon domain-containing protein [Candidatus Firestonebacteria bacterium]
MPVYEFECKKCRNKFEVLLNFSEIGKGIKCPKCKSFKVDKLFSIFGFKSSSQTVSLSSSSHSCGGCTSHNCSTCK